MLLLLLLSWVLYGGCLGVSTPHNLRPYAQMSMNVNRHQNLLLHFYQSSNLR